MDKMQSHHQFFGGEVMVQPLRTLNSLSDFGSLERLFTIEEVASCSILALSNA